MPGSNYNYSTGEFLFDSPEFNSPRLTAPQVTSKPVNLPTFDPEEGMYDAYIEARNAAIGANASKRKLERFYKKFRKQWDQGEALRKSEFEWNNGIQDLNNRMNTLQLNFKNKLESIVVNTQNAINNRLLVETPKPAPKLVPKPAQPIVKEDSYRAMSNQDVGPSTNPHEGGGSMRHVYNPSNLGGGNVPVTEVTGVKNPFSSKTFNTAGKAFTGTFNTMEEFNDAFTDWYGKRNGFWSFGNNNSREWDAARDNMLSEYLKYHNLTSLPNAQKPKSSSNDVVQPWRVVAAHKNGGNINKFAGGGDINNKKMLQSAILGYAYVNKLDPDTIELNIEQITQTLMKSSAEDLENYIKIGEELQKTRKAKLGAKINYLNLLKGICPEGTEKIYLAKGGCMCSQKAAKGSELKKKEQPKNEVLKFKAQKGINSKKFIEPTDTVNTKFGPRDLNGNTKYPKYDASKENYDTATRVRVHEKDGGTGHEGPYWTVSKLQTQKAKNRKTEKKTCGSKLKK